MYDKHFVCSLGCQNALVAGSPTDLSLADILDEARGEDEDDQDEGLSGTYLVRFDGQVYWTRLFVDTETAG